MKAFLILAAVNFVGLVSADSTSHRSISEPKLKRAYLTCQQTYGGGSVTCGASDSHFCYDPTLGESCCLLDDGYCKQGDFCAPVAGFCCHNGEDLSTCATRLGFAIPPSLLTSSTLSGAIPSSTSEPSDATASTSILVSPLAVVTGDGGLLTATTATGTGLQPGITGAANATSGLQGVVPFTGAAAPSLDNTILSGCFVALGAFVIGIGFAA